MMCFVEYRTVGFWCKSEMLRDWIAELVSAARSLPHAPEWLTNAAAYWEALRSAARYARSDLRFDVSVTTPGQRDECLKFLEIVGQKNLDYGAESVNAAAVSLFRGELEGQPTIILD